MSADTLIARRLSAGGSLWPSASRASLGNASLSRSASVFAHLYIGQLASFREGWRWQVAGGVVAPLACMFVLTALLNAGALPDSPPDPGALPAGPDGGTHVLAGSLALSALFTAMARTAHRLAWLKERGLDYYAMLPVDRGVTAAAAILACVTSSLLLTVVAALLGRLLFSLSLASHPLAAVVLLLTVLALAGAGAGIATVVPDMRWEQAATRLALFAAAFLSPVLVPAEKLPPLVQLVGYLFPTRYAVDALRRLSSGTVDLVVLLDLVVLAAFAGASLYAVTRWFTWRRP